MNTIINLLQHTDGYKTYAIGLMMICVGVYKNNSELILEGVAIITLRLGIKKVEK